MSIASRTIAGLMLAATLSAGIVPAAQAQGFNFGFGAERPFSDLLCANEYQVRQIIGRRGFTDIFLNAREGRYIQARATRGNWVYLVRFDRCAKQIVETSRLRRAR